MKPNFEWGDECCGFPRGCAILRIRHVGPGPPNIPPDSRLDLIWFMPCWMQSELANDLIFMENITAISCLLDRQTDIYVFIYIFLLQPFYVLLICPPAEEKGKSLFSGWWWVVAKESACLKGAAKTATHEKWVANGCGGARRSQ